jgi:hypothetical protein
VRLKRYIEKQGEFCDVSIPDKTANTLTNMMRRREKT